MHLDRTAHPLLHDSRRRDYLCPKAQRRTFGLLLLLLALVWIGIGLLALKGGGLY